METPSIRQQLVTAYHILGHLGLDDHTYTHLSAREESHFYIYPFGLRFEEVTEDNLLTVSFDGTVLKGHESQYNRTGYVIHGEIYKARPDLKTIFHLHTPATVAVSALEEGLLPMSQWALHFYGHVSYHAYSSLALEHSQGAALAKDLGDNKVMFLRNHGMIACGNTLQEALFYTYHLEQACKAQCLALGMGRPLSLPSAELCQKAQKDLISFEKDLGLRDWKAWERKINRTF